MTSQDEIEAWRLDLASQRVEQERFEFDEKRLRMSKPAQGGGAKAALALMKAIDTAHRRAEQHKIAAETLEARIRVATEEKS